MKKLLLVTACACLAQLTQAQVSDKDPHFGVKLGANASTIKFNPGLVQTDISWKFGVAGGFTYTYPISKSLSIQPEILYSQMGAKFDNKNVSVTLDKGTLTTHYISVPLQLKINAGERFAFTAGPQVDFFIDARYKYDNTGQPRTGYFTGFDILGTVGAEFNVTRNLAIFGRYMHGFKNINYNMRTYDGALITSKAYNRGIQFGLAWYFRHKPVVAPPPPPPPPIPDTDGDGILDNVDKCPTVAGVAKYQGCPIPDTDKDGINDEQDKCPTTPGIAKYNGCPIPDTDNDGVNDEEDKCPTVAGLAKYQGCPPPDRDGDGVIDEEDKCPDVAGPASNGGCPSLEGSTFNSKAVQFNSGTATLTAAAQKELNDLVTLMNDPKYAPLKVSIEGHTDNTGKAASNQTLSEKRAASVKTYLVKKGVNADRLSTAGFGDTAPIADNKTTAGKATNRRVEFKVTQ